MLKCLMPLFSRNFEGSVKVRVSSSSSNEDDEGSSKTARFSGFGVLEWKLQIASDLRVIWEFGFTLYSLDACIYKTKCSPNSWT